MDHVKIMTLNSKILFWAVQMGLCQKYQEFEQALHHTLPREGNGSVRRVHMISSKWQC